MGLGVRIRVRRSDWGQGLGLGLGVRIGIRGSESLVNQVNTFSNENAHVEVDKDVEEEKAVQQLCQRFAVYGLARGQWSF